jgi:hypothetical protein
MPPSHYRAVIRLLLCAIMLASGRGAWAADERTGLQQSVAVDVKRLGAELDLFSAEAHRARLAAALTGLGIGSALVPSGIVLLERTDGVSRALVIGMITGGSAQIVSVPFLFIPTRMSEIRDEFTNRQMNFDSQAMVRTFENEWRLAAEASRRKRGYLGVTLLVVGVVHLATGLSLLLASEGALGMSRKTQYTWGGVMLGIGVPVTTLGVRFLLEWSPEETSWEAYRAMKFNADSLGRQRTPSVGVIPVQGGALAFASLPF